MDGAGMKDLAWAGHVNLYKTSSKYQEQRKVILNRH